MLLGAFTRLIIWFSLFCPKVVSWKDEWILTFEKNAMRETEKEEPQSSNCIPSKRLTNCTWRLPRHISPVRITALVSQRIPKVIFQTWKSYNAAGPSQWKSVMSFVEHNPDYEYYLFDDQAVLNFIRAFHSERAALFELILPGAMRADIWRLAIIQRYGGVYVDIDSHSQTPFSQFIWPNASVVTGLGAQMDFHQWALLYTPNHPIMNSALQYAWHRVKTLHRNNEGGSVAQTTGPGAFHAAVKNTLYTHECSISRLPRNKSTVFIHYIPHHYCSASVGVLQIYTTDYLGGNIIFKDTDTDKEMKSVSLHYSTAQKQYSGLFKTEVSIPSAQDVKRNKVVSARKVVKSGY